MRINSTYFTTDCSQITFYWLYLTVKPVVMLFPFFVIPEVSNRESKGFYWWRLFPPVVLVLTFCVLFSGDYRGFLPIGLIHSVMTASTSFHLFFSLAPWWERVRVRGILIFIVIYLENTVTGDE